MKVRVLSNYQDENHRVHLVNDVLEIDKSQFDSKLHSEAVTKKKAVTNRKKTKPTEVKEDV